LPDKGLLVIAAHPDDETLGCGATIAVHSMKGCRCSLLTLTCDDEARRDELHQAAKILGAEAPIVFPEGELRIDRQTIHRISDVIVADKPEIVITHLPYDYHREHRLANRLVKEAIEWAAHRTTYREPWTTEKLLLMEVNTLIPTPSITVNVSSSFSRKQEAVRCYRTQRQKLADDYYERFSEAKATLRGVQGDCVYAEAFLEEAPARNSPFYSRRAVTSLLKPTD